ncbi:hypothetical protein HDU92_003694 [Lobulomyces angularis]|nr:hypothetical protein HDU92_003694 [Lobulomyces angularis]
MSYWKEAGLSYLQYSNIAAKALRNVLKEAPKLEALKREEQYARIAKWTNGKAGEYKIVSEYVPPATAVKHD